MPNGACVLSLLRSPPVYRLRYGFGCVLWKFWGWVNSYALLVGPDGVTGNTRETFDLSLTCVGLEQRPDGGLQIWFQNVHSNGPLGFKGKESNVLPVLTLADQRTRSMRQFNIARVEQFDWPQVEHFGWPSGDSGIGQSAWRGVSGRKLTLAKDGLKNTVSSVLLQPEFSSHAISSGLG